MKRGFLIFALCVAGVFYGWDRGVTRDGIARFIDDHPTLPGADTVLYVLGSYHELFNNHDQALAMYERVAKNYPESSHGDEAYFGMAVMWEAKRQKSEAVRAYKMYLEKYPEGRFHKSVKKKLDLMAF